ncbi:hypothetical protein GN244_ATG08775 [Phytophthora infestans]|uniref:Uncharacterized protein n=1 Tax=Phytophthora infestans TaxID=4787 RepID=A0A833SUT4_PHYIN|nr:hypothetical protein GN244_ATG08775 [Phytophthora infestans]
MCRMCSVPAASYRQGPRLSSSRSRKSGYCTTSTDCRALFVCAQATCEEEVVVQVPCEKAVDQVIIEEVVVQVTSECLHLSQQYMKARVVLVLGLDSKCISCKHLPNSTTPKTCVTKGWRHQQNPIEAKLCLLIQLEKHQ